jgi:hypothetical protein
LTEFKERQEQEINYLFDDARKELAKVDENAKELKKDIVKKLAKKLEGKIPTDTICIEIVTQLKGPTPEKVSERFIRECLDEKYKQKHKVENAKKKKKQKQEENNNLAAETPLDNNEVITVDADSRTSFFQRDEDDKSSKTATDDDQPDLINDKTFTQSPYISHLEQDNSIKERADHLDNEIKDQSSDDSDYQNLEQDEVIDKPYQVTTNNENRLKIFPEDKSISTFNISAGILPFEFSWSFKEVRNYLTPLYRTTGDSGRIWFSGRINKNTGEVISHFGRLYQQLQEEHPDGNTGHD